MVVLQGSDRASCLLDYRVYWRSIISPDLVADRHEFNGLRVAKDEAEKPVSGEHFGDSLGELLPVVLVKPQLRGLRWAGLVSGLRDGQAKQGLWRMPH